MRHASWTAIENSPRLMRLYQYYRRLPNSVRSPLRWIATPRSELLGAWLRQRAENRVQSGPFEGTSLELTAVSSRNLLGYLLGTQELELHSIIETIIARDYDNVINIGAADGYYAIGLARRMPNTVIDAYEALHEHHSLLRLAAKKNGVSERVRVRGLCTIPLLSNSLKEGDAKRLVLADIEGAEVQLLDPEKVRSLFRTDILVETHDVIEPGCSDCLLRRFADSHEIIRIRSRPRTLNDFPPALTPRWAKGMTSLLVEAMNERRRGEQEWLFLSART